VLRCGAAFARSTQKGPIAKLQPCLGERHVNMCGMVQPGPELGVSAMWFAASGVESSACPCGGGKRRMTLTVYSELLLRVEDRLRLL
jgi:hypothetical protein